MTEITPKVVALTLALITSISQWFSDGMTAVVEKQYGTAITAFTQVIEAPVDANPLYDMALYWRAQSYMQLDKNGPATKDIEALLKRSPDGPLAPLATADYRVLTGKPWQGAAFSTPEETWRSLAEAVQRKDGQGLQRCCTGQMKAELQEIMESDGDFWPEIGGEILSLKLTSVVYNTESNKALVTLAEPAGDGRGDTQRIVMEADNGKWLLADEYDSDMAEEFEGAALTDEQEKQEKEDAGKLDVLRRAFKGYLVANGRMPRRLSDLKSLVENFARASISAIDGKPFVYVAPADGKPPWIFTASVYAGRRQGYILGEVTTMPESDFREAATVYGIKVPEIRDDMDLTPAEEETVKKLIGQLGDPSFTVRKSAFDKLKEVGPAAREFIENATRHRDPEIAVKARVLLRDM